MNGLRLAIAAVAGVALVGCGGAKIGSKEEAAAVVNTMGSTGNKANSQGGLMKLFQSGAGGTGAVSVECTNGGTAEASFDFTGTSTTGALAFKMTFNGCTEPVYDDPSTEAVEREDVTYNGEITLTMDTSISDTSVSFAMVQKGRIDLSGAISDFVEVDITHTMLVTTTDTSATASFQLNGTVKTSTETFVYDNEKYVVTAEGDVVVSTGA